MSLTPIVQDPIQDDIDSNYDTLIISGNEGFNYENDSKTAKDDLGDNDKDAGDEKYAAQDQLDAASAAALLSHAAQIAKNVAGAEAARDTVETAKDAAATNATNAEGFRDSALANYIIIAQKAGVSYKDAAGVVVPVDGPSYLNPSGILVASMEDTASGLAAEYYIAARDSLDGYNMKLANYNNALAVPASDVNKKSPEVLGTMLADVNTAADSYNAAQLMAKGSAKLADLLATRASQAYTTYNNVVSYAKDARLYANRAAALFTTAQNDVTNAASKPIIVNMNIEIDAENNISVFGEKPIVPENTISASYKIPVDSLYDNVNTKGLIEFWEPVDAQGDIRVELAHTALCGGEDSYKETAVKLVNEIERCLCDKFDCGNAKPFNDAKYNMNTTYTTQRDFGRVALGTLAHFLFGHVDATSAITNDVAFIQNMLSLTLGTASEKESAAINEDVTTGPPARFAAYDPMVLADVSDLVEEVGSSADAKLAKRLVGAILRKGLGADVSGGRPFKSSNVIANADDSNCLANIVRQVIGQDQTRSMNQDNSERTTDEHILLRFYPLDIIYMNIKLKKPTVTLSPGPNAYSSLTPASLSNSYANEISFTLQVTLD